VSEHAHAVPQAEEVAPAAPAVAPAASMAGFVTQLQRTAGNRAVVQLLARQPAAAPAETLDETDVTALQAYGKVFALQQSGADAATSAPAKRDAIVKLALSQVGKVLDEDRGDGKKKGADRIKEFYRVACPGYMPAYDWGIENLHTYAAMTPTDRSKDRKPWSWCAIFGVWAIHQIIGRGQFAAKPIGLGPPIYFSKKGARDAVKPGDMVVRREQYEIEGREKDKDPLNHQCLVAHVDRTDPKRAMLTTVNGNGPKQSIYVRTEPLSYYNGYYDTLSEVPVDGS